MSRCVQTFDWYCMLTWAIFRTFLLGCLLGFIPLLGSFEEVEMLMLFMLEQGELHTIAVGSAEAFSAVRGT